MRSTTRHVFFPPFSLWPPVQTIRDRQSKRVPIQPSLCCTEVISATDETQIFREKSSVRDRETSVSIYSVLSLLTRGFCFSISPFERFHPVTNHWHSPDQVFFICVNLCFIRGKCSRSSPRLHQKLRQAPTFNQSSETCDLRFAKLTE